MRIAKIYIKNFKRISILEYYCNSEFNFVVGENNIGKSTIFEAIHLWKVAYSELVTSKGDKFYSMNSHRYLNFSDLFFLRIRNDNEIFNDPKNKEIVIGLEIINGDDKYYLEVTLDKPLIQNTYFRIKIHDEEYIKFAEKVKSLGLSLSNSIFIFQTHPIFYSLKNEPFLNNAQLIKKISLGRSHEVIRNKILKSGGSENKFTNIEKHINNILQAKYKIRCKNKSRQDDEYIKITFQEIDKKEIEISSMGSGILQITDIFSTLEFINRKEHCLNILLIDEPDSHLHSNIQSRLIDELKQKGDSQIFLISHNDRLIDKANDGELFFLNEESYRLKKLESLNKNSYNTVSGDLAAELLSVTNDDKIIILTEGKTDKKILEVAWSKLNPGKECPYKIISSGIEINYDNRTGNADTVRRTCELVSSMKTQLKVVGLFDNDREGNEQFKGLNKKAFENYEIGKDYRKHKELNIWGLLLPTPSFRQKFVTDNIHYRFIEIESYFKDHILEENLLKGDPILETDIFEINDGSKNSFSEKVDEYNKAEFDEFKILFSKINHIVEVN